MTEKNITIETTFIGCDGGPCAGKTSGLSGISDKLTEIGMMPFIIPEAATSLIKAGITPQGFETSADFQEHLVQLQLDNKKNFEKAGTQIARRLGKRPIFLCDRGVLSAAAYLPGTPHERLLALNEILLSKGSSVENARAKYVGVIHLVTAALGAEKFYTLENNQARKETLHQARERDEATINAWIGHSHLTVIGNRLEDGRPKPFEQKMQEAKAHVLHMLGYPEPIEIEDKYLLRGFNPFELSKVGIEYQMVSIEQHYLETKDLNTAERIRKRSAFGRSAYFYTIKMPYPWGGGRVEREWQISKEEFLRLLLRRDLNHVPIMKQRYCFLWKYQYFEADVFSGKQEGLALLEREKTNENKLTELPPFLQIEKEVTNDPMYSNYELSRA